MVNLADIMDLCYELTTMAFPGCKRRCKLPSPPPPPKRVATQNQRVKYLHGAQDHVSALQGMHRDEEQDMASRERDPAQMLTGASHDAWPCVVSSFCCGFGCSRRHNPSTSHSTAIISTHSIHTTGSHTLHHPGPPQKPAVYTTSVPHHPPRLPSFSEHDSNLHADPDLCCPFVLTVDGQPGREPAVPTAAHAAVQGARQHVRKHSIELQTIHRNAHIPPGHPLQHQPVEDAPHCWYPGLPESGSLAAGSGPGERQWLSFTGQVPDAYATGAYSRGQDARGHNNWLGTEGSTWCAAAAAEVQHGWAKSNTCSPYARVCNGAGVGASYEQQMSHERASKGAVRCWGVTTGSAECDRVQASGTAFTAAPGHVQQSRTLHAELLGGTASLAQLQSRLCDLQKSLSVLPRSPAFMPQKHIRVLDSARGSGSSDEGVYTALEDTARLSEVTTREELGSPCEGTTSNTNKVTQDSCSSIELARARAGARAVTGRDEGKRNGKAVLQCVDMNQVGGKGQRNGHSAVLAACGHNPDGYCECSQCAALAWNGSGKEGDDVLSRVRRELRELEQEERDGAFASGLSSSPHGLSGSCSQGVRMALKGENVDGKNKIAYAAHGVHANMPSDMMMLHGAAARCEMQAYVAATQQLRQHEGLRHDVVCNKVQHLLPDRVQPAPVVKLGTMQSDALPAPGSPKSAGQGSGSFWAVSSLLGQSLGLSQSWSIGTKVQQSVAAPDRERPRASSGADSAHSARGSLLSWLLPGSEPSSSSSTHRSPDENTTCQQIDKPYQNDVPSSFPAHWGHRPDISVDLGDHGPVRPYVQQLGPPSHISMTDVTAGQHLNPPRRSRHAFDVLDTHPSFTSSAAPACLSAQQTHSIPRDGSTDLYAPTCLSDRQHYTVRPDGSTDVYPVLKAGPHSGLPQKSSLLAAVFPKMHAAQDPVGRAHARPSNTSSCVSYAARREGMFQPGGKPPMRPLYHKAGTLEHAPAGEWRTADQSTAARVAPGLPYREWIDSDSSDDVSSSSCHLQQPLADLYSPVLFSGPSMYQDLACPAALQVANEIMMCMTLPGGIQYSPVSADSPLFVLGVIHEFTAFDVALAATYLQRIVRRQGMLERVINIVVVPHLQSWDGTAHRQQRQLTIPPEYSSQRSLLSVLQFVSLTLAAKVLGTQVDISTEAMRVHISRSYSLPVALSQALDVELMCLDALGWQLGPYLQEDKLEWLQALECV